MSCLVGVSASGAVLTKDVEAVIAALPKPVLRKVSHPFLTNVSAQERGLPQCTRIYDNDGCLMHHLVQPLAQFQHNYRLHGTTAKEIDPDPVRAASGAAQICATGVVKVLLQPAPREAKRSF